VAAGGAEDRSEPASGSRGSELGTLVGLWCVSHGAWGPRWAGDGGASEGLAGLPRAVRGWMCGRRWVWRPG
jgi:hypothetical protein